MSPPRPVKRLMISLSPAKWLNPHNLTRIHLSSAARRYRWEIGDYSYGRPKIRFPESGARLAIGRYCSFADRIDILLGGNHRLDWASTYPFSEMGGLWPEARGLPGAAQSKGDVRIGNDVWVGSGATILSGVTIGDGAVIAARAVVTRDVPPYGVVAGNPGRLVRLRLTESDIAGLLETRWWELERDEVATLVPLIQSGRVSELIEAVRMIRRTRGAKASL